MTRKLMLALVALAAVCATLPHTASAARIPIRVGIGDQQAAMFEDADFRRLKLKRVRYFIPWNAMRDSGQRLRARDYVLRARRAGTRVLLHVSTHDLRERRAKLPSTRAYRRDVGRLVRYFRKLGVREWGVWNEANHKSQPTYRSPRRAAQYYRIMYRLCRGCTIVALDVLDQAGVERYVRRWYSALSRTYRRRARIVGIHNYSDVNRRRSSGTRSIIRAVRRRNGRARFWFTETGGVVKFGRSFPCNERRAANRLRTLFSIARSQRRRVQRVYVYNWTGATCGARFDAGLTRSDGTLRPGYHVVRAQLKRFLR